MYNDHEFILVHKSNHQGDSPQVETYSTLNDCIYWSNKNTKIYLRLLLIDYNGDITDSRDILVNYFH